MSGPIAAAIPKLQADLVAHYHNPVRVSFRRSTVDEAVRAGNPVLLAWKSSTGKLCCGITPSERGNHESKTNMLKGHLGYCTGNNGDGDYSTCGYERVQYYDDEPAMDIYKPHFLMKTSGTCQGWEFCGGHVQLYQVGGWADGHGKVEERDIELYTLGIGGAGPGSYSTTTANGGVGVASSGGPTYPVQDEQKVAPLVLQHFRWSMENWAHTHIVAEEVDAILAVASNCRFPVNNIDREQEIEGLYTGVMPKVVRGTTDAAALADLMPNCVALEVRGGVVAVDRASACLYSNLIRTMLEGSGDAVPTFPIDLRVPVTTEAVQLVACFLNIIAPETDPTYHGGDKFFKNDTSRPYWPDAFETFLLLVKTVFQGSTESLKKVRAWPLLAELMTLATFFNIPSLKLFVRNAFGRTLVDMV